MYGQMGQFMLEPEHVKVPYIINIFSKLFVVLFDF